MSLIDLLRTAFRNVAANKLRAALTMLGVVIGVASVIAMLALGNGARAAVEATFQDLGANQIQIGQRFEMQDGEFAPTGEKLTYEEGLEMLDSVPLVERVEMSVGKTLKARFGRATIEISAIGTTPDALEGFVASGEVQPVGWTGDAAFSAEDLIGEGRFFSTDEVSGRCRTPGPLRSCRIGSGAGRSSTRPPAGRIVKPVRRPARRAPFGSTEIGRPSTWADASSVRTAPPPARPARSGSHGITDWPPGPGEIFCCSSPSRRPPGRPTTAGCACTGVH